ncbi:MAG: nucleotidyl transferase AbiEii/AbiGii toxin family protein [Acidimicrobiales bacterium]
MFPILELVTSGKPLVRYIGPCRPSKPRNLKVDISTDEYVEGFAAGRVASAWPDLPPQHIFDVYTLEEIAAEKLRPVMQRLQCRDLSICIV